ncbi:MAG: TraR/DksA C4-type zinc finger protein [Sedimentitalea sp.]|uniref:TraR/DksA family transcriptional regulator n=1 Tax=Sedimentitalea sp. TaxID=2048915 RepID=UPI00326585E9
MALLPFPRLEYASMRAKAKRKALMGHIQEMNETDLDRYAAQIEQMLHRLTEDNELGREGQAVVSLDQQSVGRLSRMDALQNQAMAKAQQQLRDQQKQRLLAALRRIDEGEFGYCVDCGVEIAAKRLDLDPEVFKCISCANG